MISRKAVYTLQDHHKYQQLYYPKDPLSKWRQFVCGPFVTIEEAKEFLLLDKRATEDQIEIISYWLGEEDDATL